MGEDNALFLAIIFPNGRAKGVPFVIDLWQTNLIPNCGVTVGLFSDSVSKSLHTDINITGILFLFQNQDPEIRAFQN